MAVGVRVLLVCMSPVRVGPWCIYSNREDVGSRKGIRSGFVWALISGAYVYCHREEGRNHRENAK